MTVVPFGALTDAQREQAAALLVAAFAHMASAWADLATAREEVATFLADPERTAWAAVEDGAVRGWVGAIRTYDGHVWELHPLAVDPACRRRGIGTRLVRALEAAARAAGVSTVMLGTDDDFGGTTAFGADLWADLPGHLAGVAARDEAPAPHPLPFYRALGYAVVGFVPDANGPGRPDIIMARSLAAGTTA